VNPRHPDALRLRADTLLAEGDTAAAERQLLAAKLVNPRDEATLARLAAIAHLLRKPEAVAAIEKEVLAFDAKPGVFYAELAEVLVTRKQYRRGPRSASRRPANCGPTLSAPRAGLGLLFIATRPRAGGPRCSSTRRSRPTRSTSACRTPSRCSSTSRPTRRFETPHFVIKYDAKADAVLAGWLGEHLELWHAEFTKLYGAAPPGKLLVEVFATREMFSGRVLSLPGLPGAAQGASTGPLIAIPSPKVDGRAAPYNWASGSPGTNSPTPST
jgi:hypothetical protein